MVETRVIMTEEIATDYIDFEEEKAKLWQLAYSEIKRIIELKGWNHQRVELPKGGQTKSIVLEMPDVLLFEDCYGNWDYCETFKDDVMFETYNMLVGMITPGDRNPKTKRQ